MIDKDGVFLDALEDQLYNAMVAGTITEGFCDQMLDLMLEVRDTL